MTLFRVHIEATYPDGFEITAKSFQEARDKAVDKFFEEVNLDVDVEIVRRDKDGKSE